MSYEIIYDKQFISLGDGLFVPMFYTGSNNCTDIKYNKRGKQYERRSRDWQEIPLHNSVGDVNTLVKYATLDTFVASIDAYRLQKMVRYEQYKKEHGESWGEYSDKEFGYHASIAIGSANTSKTSFKTYKNLWILGVKEAMTVEQLRALGVSIDLGVVEYLYKDELLAAGKEAKKFYPKTSAELKENIDELAAYYAGSKVRFWIHLSMGEDTLKWHRKQTRLKAPKKVKVKKEVSEYYVFEGPTGGYFVKGTKNGYQYSNYKNASSNARKYTMKDATKKLDEINKKYGYKGKFEIATVTLTHPTIVMV